MAVPTETAWQRSSEYPFVLQILAPNLKLQSMVHLCLIQTYMKKI